MSAQISSRHVAAANAESIRLVRPEESAPLTSVRQPRGNPPVSASTCRMPKEAVSGEGRISRWEAEVIPACGDLRVNFRNREADFASRTPAKAWVSIGNNGEAMRNPQPGSGCRIQRLITFAFYSPTTRRFCYRHERLSIGEESG